ncbi:MAG: hypothetical protein H6713_03855 [Myxococcales bacterium]|nr:hypothetical protein [Myxococcales bacterium]MCB9749124.1 hypothetical protein [Myxococcales bacterium]
MRKLSCRSCGAELDGGQLDRRLAIITCSHCGAIFDLARRGGGGVNGAASTAEDTSDRAGEPQVPRGGDTPERAPVAMPSHFRVERDGGRLAVRWRWFQWSDIFLLFFAIAWDAFLVGFYAMMSLANDAPGPMKIIMYVFPLAHVAVGVGITYRALAGLLNTTTLVVEERTLSVRHFPLPWWPAPKIPVDSLEQLYATKKIKHGKNTATVTYELRAVTREHHGRLLLAGLQSLDQALWLEQEIELLLNIRDRPVAGEVKGDDVHV